MQDIESVTNVIPGRSFGVVWPRLPPWHDCRDIIPNPSSLCDARTTTGSVFGHVIVIYANHSTTAILQSKSTLLFSHDYDTLYLVRTVHSNT
jgi:hypothetical protein